MTANSERDYYTVEEAARQLDVSHATVWRWIDSGRLPAYRVGPRRFRVRKDDLAAVVVAAPVAATPAPDPLPVPPAHELDWAAYDPARARAAVRTAAGALAGVDLAPVAASGPPRWRAGRRAERCLVDSDLLLALFAGRGDAGPAFEALAEVGLAISALSFAGAYEGVLRSPTPARAGMALSPLLESVPVLGFSAQVARRLAILRVGLARGGGVGEGRWQALAIAATAGQHGLCVATCAPAAYAGLAGVRLLDLAGD